MDDSTLLYCNTYEGYPYSTLADPSEFPVYQLVDLVRNPLCVILDLGCTRSMGSKRAVIAFEEAAWSHGIVCEWKRCWTRMSFANSQTAWLEWCVVVHFPTEPPICTTIDVHDQGDIPILLSLPQMMNLGLDLKLRPGSVELTFEALGYHKELSPFTTSRHVAMDLSRIHGKIQLTRKPTNDHSDNLEKSFVNTDVSTEAPTERSAPQTEEESDRSSVEDVESDYLDEQRNSLAVADEGSAFPTRRRLSGKTKPNDERSEGGVPVQPRKGKKAAPKPKGTTKHKQRGNPDVPISVRYDDKKAVDDPRPHVD